MSVFESRMFPGDAPTHFLFKPCVFDVESVLAAEFQNTLSIFSYLSDAIESCDVRPCSVVGTDSSIEVAK